MVDLREGIVYRKYRIHPQQLPSGLWLVSIVNLGKRKLTTENSLTDAVSRVPGEFDSEEQASRAAKEYIDQQGEREGSA